MSSLSAFQVEEASSTPRKRPPTPMKTDLPSSFFRRRQLGSVSSMASHQLRVTHKLSENSDILPLPRRRKELDTLTETEKSEIESSEVSQDVASDSGIGDMVFAGTDSLGQLSNEVETNEKSQSSTAEEMSLTGTAEGMSLTGTAEGMSLTGTAEGMPLTGTVEGMPLHDTAEGITPNGTLDEKKLKLTVLGMQDEVKSLYVKWLETFSESESFESFVVQRLDDMLRRAYSLEKDLQDQKAKLRGRLTLLSHTLLGMADEETDQ